MSLEFLDFFSSTPALIFYGVVLVGWLLGRLFFGRALYVRRFRTEAGQRFKTDELASHIYSLLAEYEDAHTRGPLSAAGAKAGFTKPPVAKEGFLPAALRFVFLENSPLSTLYTLFSPVLPLRQLVGDIESAEEGDPGAPWRVTGRIVQRKRFQERSIVSVTIPLAGRDELENVGTQLTYTLLLRAGAKSSRIRRVERPGTDKWTALHALTRALKVWKGPADASGSGSSDGDSDDTRRMEAKRLLEEAIAEDPSYPLAHYNLGVLYYSEAGTAANEAATTHFETARDEADRLLAEERGRLGSDADTRLMGLACLGLARVYSQSVHRYGGFAIERDGSDDATGSPGPADVAEARNHAALAVQHLRNDPQARYADAFAWHCTVSDGLTDQELDALETDLEKGRKKYQGILRVRGWRMWRGARERYRVVHNNLGYVLMMLGELRMNESRTGNAKWARVVARWRWWQARRHMEIARDASRSQDNTKAYSWANLGNLERLQGDYEAAETGYTNAMSAWEAARKHDSDDTSPQVYIDGRAERARLYVEWADGDGNAVEDHITALLALAERRETTSPDARPECSMYVKAGSARHAFKVARMFLIACERAGKLGGESLASAEEWLSEEDAPSIGEWRDRMESLLPRRRSPPEPPRSRRAGTDQSGSSASSRS